VSLPWLSVDDLLLTKLLAHRDAIKLAKILHRDISLFNLLFTPGAPQRNLLEDLLWSLPQMETKCRETLQGLVDKWCPCHGLLADWGYAVPTPDHPDFSSLDNLFSMSGVPLGRPTTHTAECSEKLPLPHHLKYPPLVDSVPVKRAEDVVFVPCNELQSTDDIVIPMASDTSQSVDDAKDKLHRTVCSFFSSYRLHSYSDMS
jgi:hypothetical protein